MTARITIVGAGAAGLAAAWSACRAGHEVTVVGAGPGASALAGGAVDDMPWEQMLRAARLLGEETRPKPLPLDVAEFSHIFGLWHVAADRRAWLATIAGRIRPARGRDRALLNLAELSGKTVLIPRAARVGWDADSLAATLAVDSFALDQKITFRAVDVPVLRLDDEHRIGDADLAARHDDAARRRWLIERLRSVIPSDKEAGAVLLGPWLGAHAPHAEELSAALGMPVGEALAGTGSPAGLRFEAARDTLLSTLAVRRLRGRVVAVVPDEQGLRVSLADDAGTLEADKVVLAFGGLVGGGVCYAPPEHHAGTDMPPGTSVPFELSVQAPVSLSMDGQDRLALVSSLHGPELDATAWPSFERPGALETVGVRCEGARAASGIFAAGDAMAGRPRTLLAAVLSGIVAGTA